jgi:4-hydroxybenzoate polyprenyltransferase
MSGLNVLKDTVDSRPRFSKLVAFFWLLRLNRSVMVAMITGAAAFTAGAGVANSLWMMLAAWMLAVGGFSLDFNVDRDVDSIGPRAQIRHNPFTDNSLSPGAGMIFSLSFIIASVVVVIIIAPRVLIPWSVTLAVIIGMMLHCFERPLARSFTLGILQALHIIIGGATGRLSPGLWLLAGMFFFAMFGGRGMIDIRDFSQDTVTEVQTLPKRYGIKRTAQFTAVCLFISFALSLAAYFTGEFSIIYLYLDIAFIAVGSFCAGLFAVRPGPRLAYYLTLVCMMGTGTLICLAMILGSL